MFNISKKTKPELEKPLVLDNEIIIEHKPKYTLVIPSYKTEEVSGEVLTQKFSVRIKPPISIDGLMKYFPSFNRIIITPESIEIEKICSYRIILDNCSDLEANL